MAGGETLTQDVHVFHTRKLLLLSILFLDNLLACWRTGIVVYLGSLPSHQLSLILSQLSLRLSLFQRALSHSFFNETTLFFLMEQQTKEKYR